MTEDPKAGRAVPGSRIARLGGFGRMAGGVMGSALAGGARELASGRRPKMRDLMLTPGNVARVADELSRLRGAAMKLGQMVSMDAGDVLPPELTAILARLREGGHTMPPAQLARVLEQAWGRDWRRRFAHFEAHPVAAASIGQVHRATLPDGRKLAIKVQYPGVADSIDSDIDNVATLLRLSGLLPPTLAIDPLLAEAKRQLHEEADYLREAQQMVAYRAMLAGDERFVVPEPVAEFSTDRVLAMSFIEGQPIERLESAPQPDRDRMMATMIDLVLRELFVFGMMQTDPNFANFRFQTDPDRLVLLDFGATRSIEPWVQDGYVRLFRAGLAGDRDAVREAALGIGFLGEAALERHRALVDRMIDVILSELGRPGLFDFGDRAFVGVLREQGMEMARDRSTWHVPPADTLFVQRKISGTALLGARLKAQVDVRSLAQRIVGPA